LAVTRLKRSQKKTKREVIEVEVKMSFTFEKETKNCYRFKEVAGDKPVVVGTIYLKKRVFEKKPAGIEVTVQGIPEKGGGESV